MSWSAFAFVVWLALAQGSAARPAQQPEVLWRDGTAQGQQATDLVFLPDGFLAAEKPAFEASVRKAVRLLESQPASFVRADRASWNIHVGFVPSNAVCPARPGEPAADTAFHTHLGRAEEGGLFESDDAAIAKAASALSPGTDAVVVIVRAASPLRFATGDLPREGARIRLPEGFEDVLLHELGHSLYSLGDEYAGRDVPLPECERAVVAFYPNVSLDAGGARFSFLGVEAPSVVEGALDFRRGVFRPAGPCIMLVPSAARFCPACSAVIRAGRPAGAPESAPRLALVEPDEQQTPWDLELEPAAQGAGVVRRFVVLFRLLEPTEDEDLFARFVAAEARVSRKTRYMESPWLGDGSLPGETVFSLEGQVRRLSLGKLESGAFALVAADANLLALSPAVVVRFEVPASKSSEKRAR